MQIISQSNLATQQIEYKLQGQPLSAHKVEKSVVKERLLQCIAEGSYQEVS